MYLEHFGLSEPPFRITPHTGFFFTGGNRGATLDALAYAITQDQGIVRVSGEVGSGKTMLCRVLIERLPDNVTTIYLATPSLSREDILYAIAEELGIAIPENSRDATVLKLLQQHLISAYGEGRQVVVLIDEAHAMPIETLEEIRLLSNLESNRSKLLQLVLFGQPELNDVLARPDMRQLKERITHNFMLEPLIRDDIASYLDFRLRAAGYKGPPLFTPRIIKTIEKASLGLTRRINILADKALLAAFANGSHAIGMREINAAIKDCEFSEATAPQNQKFAGIDWPPSIQTTLTAGALALGGMAWLYALNMPPPPAQTTALPTQSASAAPVPTVPPPASPAQSPAPASPPANSQTPKAPIDPGQLLESRLAAGTEWIQTAPGSHWFLQLHSAHANELGKIESYLATAQTAGADMSQLRMYRSNLSGKDRLGVIYGDYPSQVAAQSAIATLPRVLRDSKPYPRQVTKLR